MELMAINPIEPMAPQWYLEHSGAQQHAWVIDLIPDAILIKAIDPNMTILDQTKIETHRPSP